MLKLYAAPRTRSLRVAWLLEELGVDYEVVLSEFRPTRSDFFIQQTPTGKFPTIDDDGFVLWESLAIVQYVALKHAPERLYGGDVRTFARASAWMSWTNEKLEPLLHVLVMELVRLAPAQRSAEKREAARQAILKPLAVLDAQLARTPYVAGDAFTMGDIPTGCAVRRWLVFDLERPAMPHLEAWQARLSERDGFRRHVAPREHHLGG